MDLPLNPEMQRFIEEKVRSGEYERPEDVVHAGLNSLIEREGFGDFEPGELDALIAEGDRSIREKGTVPGERVFDELRRRGEKRRARHS